MIPYEDIVRAVERFASSQAQPAAIRPAALSETAPMVVGVLETSGPIPIDADAIEEEENMAADHGTFPPE